MVAIFPFPATRRLQPDRIAAPGGGTDLKSHRGRADVSRMKTFSNLLSRLARDERGGEVLEYALVAGLLVVSAIAVIGSVGTKVLARWRSLDSSL